MTAREDFFTRKQEEVGVSLNKVQLQAVKHTEGPLLLLASPGSGKTTTIIMRIGYLIEVKGIDPARIKAVTFSRASARDMQERFKRFFPQLPPVDFSTIHSFAFQVVRDHMYRIGTAFQIIEGDVEAEEQGEQGDQDDQGKQQFSPQHKPNQPQHQQLILGAGGANLPMHKKIILRTLFKQVTGDNITDDQLEELTTYISYIKNKMIPPSDWPLVKTDVKQAERIMREYEHFKQNGHSKLLLDFDDMLVIAEQALEENEGLLRKYQRRYSYVLTDESQDTSLIQHAIVEKLVRPHNNLCVVADDDQSIYSWRGAEPAYLLAFKDKHPRAVTLFMEQNYRSTKSIVSVSNQFIKRNKNRYNKNMFTTNPVSRPVKIRRLADYNAQGKYVVTAVQKEENLAEIAVLYRNNSSSISLINAFDRAGVPFYMKDADNRFFSHWVVEDILNFMRMTYTDKRPDILEKIHMKMSGYITKQQMAVVRELHNQESVFDNLIQYASLQEYQIKQLQECKETLGEMRGMPPKPAIRVIRERLGYERAIEKMCERLGFRKEYLIGIMNTLEDIADTLDTMEDFASRLKHLEAVLKTAKRQRGQNAVTLSTFHSAKGLEFEKVFMVDLVEGIIPSNDDLKGGAKDSEALEEATRLFYVGMTRAKQQLELIAYEKRDGEKRAESQFVRAVRTIIDPQDASLQQPKPEQSKSRQEEEKRQRYSAKGARGSSDKTARGSVHTTAGIGVAAAVPFNPNALRHKSEFTIGKAVQHSKFGVGTIIKMNDERIYIRFGDGEKALSTSACLENGLLEPAAAAGEASVRSRSKG